jgi:hypothetical protein
MAGSRCSYGKARAGQKHCREVPTVALRTEGGEEYPVCAKHSGLVRSWLEGRGKPCAAYFLGKRRA